MIPFRPYAMIARANAPGRTGGAGAWTAAFAVAAGLFVGGMSVAHATTLDPLHAFCTGTFTCSDNGTVTPVDSQQPTFGITKSPDSGTYDLVLVALAPEPPSTNSALSFSFTGNSTVAASLFSATPWSTGTLPDYLGLTLANGSPANPIGAWITAGVDPNALGFYVYTANMGSVTFGSATDPTFSLSTTLPLGTLIVGFAESDGKAISTAQSGALLLTNSVLTPPTNDNAVPEPASVALLACGLLGLALVRARPVRQQ